MIHFKSVKTVLLLAFTFNLTFSCAQTEDSVTVQPNNSRANFKCGPPIIPAFIIVEGLVAGMSYYAAKPNAYGDKVIGGLYSAGSLAMLVYLPVYLTEFDNSPDSRNDKIWNSMMLLGMSYGFSRVALYNLVQAEGDNFNDRFTRNMIEINASYLIPIGLGIFTQKILFNRRKESKSSNTSFIFNGQTVGLLMRF